MDENDFLPGERPSESERIIKVDGGGGGGGGSGGGGGGWLASIFIAANGIFDDQEMALLELPTLSSLRTLLCHHTALDNYFSINGSGHRCALGTVNYHRKNVCRSKNQSPPIIT